MVEFSYGVVLAVPIGWLVFRYALFAREFAKGLVEGRPTDLSGWPAYLLIVFFFVASVAAAALFASAIFHSEDRAFGAFITMGALWLWLRKGSK